MDELEFRSQRQAAKQHKHVQRHALAMKIRGKTKKISWVSLPSHHDPHHPRGFLVGSTPARPGLRIDLGLERTFPPASKAPNDHYFMEITVVAPRKSGNTRILEIDQPRVELSQGIRPLLRRTENLLTSNLYGENLL